MLFRSKRVLGFLDASGLHMGVIAGSVIAGSFILLMPGGVSIPWSGPVMAYVLLGSSGAFLVYLYDRASGRSREDAINQPARSAWHRRHPTYRLWAGAVALGLGVWALRQLPGHVLIGAAAVGLVGALYVMPGKPGKSGAAIQIGRAHV